QPDSRGPHGPARGRRGRGRISRRRRRGLRHRRGARCQRRLLDEWKPGGDVMNESQAFDVVVVGCGGAGLTAALAAQEKGARDWIVARANRGDSGGNTGYTGAWLRMKSPEEVSEDFEEHFAVNASGYLDPTVV